MTMFRTSSKLVTLLWFVAILFGIKNASVEAQTNNEAATSTRLSLAASNSFRLILRPTFFELDFVALSIIEEAMADAIRLSTDSSLVDVNINVNQMNWLATTGDNNTTLSDGTTIAIGDEDVPTTVLRFFAVGTFLLNVPAGSPSNSGSLVSVQKLDRIIEEAFQPLNQETFIEALHNSQDPLLQGIQDVVALPTNNNVPPANQGDDDIKTEPDEPESNGISLTTLDIILIVVSGAIFLGVAYMIFQHHKDRGYIENQRARALNAYHRRNANDTRRNPNRSDEESQLEKSHQSVIENKSADSSMTSVVNNRGKDGEQPSNASAVFEDSTDQDHTFATNFALPPSPSDVPYSRHPRRTRFSSKVNITVESTQYDTMSLPSALPKPMTTNSSIQSYDEKSECKSTGALSTALNSALSVDFGAINWFRKSTAKGLSAVIGSVGVQSDIEEEDDSAVSKESAESKHSTTSSSSGSSDSSDVFRVGQVHCNKSVANESDSVSKASSVVTEWMKTIRVIPSSESKAGSEVTCKASSSSEEESTTAESSSAPGQTLIVAEDDDIQSLEHSMATSKGGVGAFSEDGGSTMEC